MIMNPTNEKEHKGLFESLDILEEQHPYWVSFVIATVLGVIVIFFTPSFVDDAHEIGMTEPLEFINLEKIQSPKRTVKKQLTTNETTSLENAEPDKAQGVSEEANAVDLAFHPSVAPPRLIGSLKKFYPKLGREKNVEAIIYTEVLISKTGRVLKVKVNGIRLLKTLPDALQADLKRQFIRSARKSLFKARFTPPVVQGKNVSVIEKYDITFNLDD